MGTANGINRLMNSSDSVPCMKNTNEAAIGGNLRLDHLAAAAIEQTWESQRHLPQVPVMEVTGHVKPTTSPAPPTMLALPWYPPEPPVLTVETNGAGICTNVGELLPILCNVKSMYAEKELSFEDGKAARSAYTAVSKVPMKPNGIKITNAVLGNRKIMRVLCSPEAQVSATKVRAGKAKTTPSAAEKKATAEAKKVTAEAKKKATADAKKAEKKATAEAKKKATADAANAKTATGILTWMDKFKADGKTHGFDVPNAIRAEQVRKICDSAINGMEISQLEYEAAVDGAESLGDVELMMFEHWIVQLQEELKQTAIDNGNKGLHTNCVAPLPPTIPGRRTLYKNLVEGKVDADATNAKRDASKQRCVDDQADRKAHGHVLMAAEGLTQDEVAEKHEVLQKLQKLVCKGEKMPKEYANPLGYTKHLLALFDTGVHVTTTNNLDNWIPYVKNYDITKAKGLIDSHKETTANADPDMQASECGDPSGEDGVEWNAPSEDEEGKSEDMGNVDNIEDVDMEDGPKRRRVITEITEHSFRGPRAKQAKEEVFSNEIDAPPEIMDILEQVKARMEKLNAEHPAGGYSERWLNDIDKGNVTMSRESVRVDAITVMEDMNLSSEEQGQILKALDTEVLYYAGVSAVEKENAEEKNSPKPTGELPKDEQAEQTEEWQKIYRHNVQAGKMGSRRRAKEEREAAAMFKLATFNERHQKDSGEPASGDASMDEEEENDIKEVFDRVKEIIASHTKVAPVDVSVDVSVDVPWYVDTILKNAISFYGPKYDLSFEDPTGPGGNYAVHQLGPVLQACSEYNHVVFDRIITDLRNALDEEGEEEGAEQDEHDIRGMAENTGENALRRCNAMRPETAEMEGRPSKKLRVED